MCKDRKLGAELTSLHFIDIGKAPGRSPLSGWVDDMEETVFFIRQSRVYGSRVRSH